MIIKIWRYDARADGVIGGGVKQRLGFDTALSSGRYIFGLEMTPDQLAVLDQVKTLGDYVAMETEDPKRIAGRYAYNLVADTPDGQVEEIALQAGRAGLDHFWHVVVSHRPGEAVTDDDREFIRRTVSRVLCVENCPAIWSTHDDQPHGHDHGLIVSFLADEDRAVPFGDHWWKEKGQIAMAICEYRLDLDPEPNRRYVADHTGVYHVLTDVRVADAEGSLVLDRKALRTLQRDHQDLMEGNDARKGYEPGDEWSLERAAQQLAAPRIQKAKSWAELHQSLARVGLRYVTVGNTGLLEAVDLHSEAEGKQRHARIAAGTAYANAALGKLSKRIGPYQPPASALPVRRFIMPRYNGTDAEKRAIEHDRLQEREEFDALLGHLEKDNSDRYRRLRDQEQGTSVNTKRQKRKQEHNQELAAARKLKRRVRRDSAARAKGTEPTAALAVDEGFAMIWGPPAGGPDSAVEMKEKAARDKRYAADVRQGGRYYFLGAELAFIERLRTIEIVSHKRRVHIDALRLASRRFAKIRVAARQLVREGLARMAAELGHKLEESKLASLATFHKSAIATGQRVGLVSQSEHWAMTADRRAGLRHAVARKKRERQCATSFPPWKLQELQDRNEIAQDAANYRHVNNPEPGTAARTLDFVDRNSLHLASSRFSQHGVRFLDDEALVVAFGQMPQHMLLASIQRRLEAIEAIQIEERRWIAAALLQGRVALEEDALVIEHERDEWARASGPRKKRIPPFAVSWRFLASAPTGSASIWSSDRTLKPGRMPATTIQLWRNSSPTKFISLQKSTGVL